MEGHPLPFVEHMNKDLVLNDYTLSLILLSEEIKRLPVAILSIVGVERSAKSFTLNHILKYLNNNNFDGYNDSLKGFDWKSGTIAQTKGVFLWSKPFIRKFNNKEIAIIVMDTQGAFGEDEKDDGFIIPFSLSISTLLIYNVFKNIVSTDLEPLELFLGRAYKNKETFKNLMILVRDFSLSSKFGFDGGKELLNQKLSGNNIQKYKLIKSHSESASVYLFPIPLNDMSSDEFRGSLSEIDERYKMHLTTLIPNVIKKLLKGTHLTGAELYSHITNSFEAIKLNEPIYSVIEVNIIKELINRAKEKLSQSLKCIDEVEEEDIEKFNKLVSKREEISSEAITGFEKEFSLITGDNSHMTIQFKENFNNTLNYIERAHLSLYVLSCIRIMKKFYANEIEIFINKGLFGKIFTRRSKIKGKSQELKSMVEEELATTANLQNHLSSESIIDFVDDLEESLQNHRKRRIKVSVHSCITLAFAAVSGALGGLLLVGAAAGGAVAAVGGVTTAGVATAGVAAGGVATAGVATAGVATAGVAAGGVATAGVATAGVAAGGAAATGGVAAAAGGAAAAAGGLGLLSRIRRKHGLDSINKIFKKSPNLAKGEKTRSDQNENSKDETSFLEIYKNTIMITERFLSIGGNVSNIVQRVKKEEKNFIKKSGFKLYFD